MSMASLIGEILLSRQRVLRKVNLKHTVHFYLKTKILIS